MVKACFLALKPGRLFIFALKQKSQGSELIPKIQLRAPIKSKLSRIATLSGSNSGFNFDFPLAEFLNGINSRPTETIVFFFGGDTKEELEKNNSA